jgi:hypothetical protein
MTDLTDCLRRRFEAVADRPVPRDWTNGAAEMGEYAQLRELVAAMRDWQRTERGDVVVRALLPRARTDELASMVLLEGIAVPAIAQCAGTPSAEFRDEIVTDVACVLLDSEDLLQLDRLVERIGKRAYRRARRRLDAESRWAARSLPLGSDAVAASTARPAEEIAVARVHLEHVYESLGEALGSGRLSTHVWEDFRDGKIGPALGYPRSDIPKRLLWKRGDRVRKVLAHTC